MLKLWGRKTSSNVQKILWALEELGQPYEHEIVGGIYGGKDKKEYASKTPTKLVPVLEDGDIALWESHSILRYLAKKFPESSIGIKDMHKEAEINCWIDFSSSAFQPAVIGLFWELVRTPSKQRSKENEEKQYKALISASMIVSKQLENRDFCGGAAIVASHIRSLGAKCKLISVIGDDNSGSFIRDKISDLTVCATPTSKFKV